MNWKKIRKLAAAVLACAMCAPTGVYAQNERTTTATIDTSMKGSISLYKYINNDGTTFEGDGIAYTTNSDSMASVIQGKLNDKEIMPEEGVKFRLLKVADIEQVTDTKDSVTGTYYTNIDSTFFNDVNKLSGNMLTSSTQTTEADKGKDKLKMHYEADTITAAMQKAIKAVGGEETFNAYVGNHALNDNCKAFTETDQNGYTKLDNLNLGLYLITEVDFQHSAVEKYDNFWKRVNGQDQNYGTTHNTGDGSSYADVVSPVSPFLLSVPMTNVGTLTGSDGKTHNAGTVWQYDLTAYPKNSTLTIHKDIVTNDNDPTPGMTDNYAQDGNDKAGDEDLCDFHQTNYTNSNSQIDGSESGGALTHQIDANIGDTVTQLISSDVPALTYDIHVDGNDTKAVEQKKNKTYKITDRMTKGLSLRNGETPTVWLSSDSWNGGENKVVLTAGTDFTYTPANDLKSFTIELTAAGLAKLDAVTKASYIYVEYRCTVTKDALIGNDTYGNQRTIGATASDKGDTRGINTKSETYDSTYDTFDAKTGAATTVTEKDADANNQNTAELTYATDRTSEHDYYSNTTHVYTYELDLTKTFSDGTKGVKMNEAGHKTDTADSGSQFDYKAVRFTLEGSVADKSVDYKEANKAGSILNPNDKTDGTADTTNYEQVLFERTGDGTYKVWSQKIGDMDGTHYNSSDAAADTITRSVDDIAVNSTVTRYLTPNSQTGLITVSGLDARTYKLVERTTAKGRSLMAEPFYVELVAPTTASTQHGSTVEVDHEDGTLAHAYVWTGKKPTGKDLEAHDVATVSATVSNSASFLKMGRVPITVQNNEVIRVLRTGGHGTVWFGLAGAAVMAAGVCFLLRKKKDDTSSAEA